MSLYKWARGGEVVTHAKEERVLQQPLHGLEQEARQAEPAALGPRALHLDKFAKPAPALSLPAVRERVNQRRDDLEADEVGLVRLKTRDERRERIRDPEDDRRLRLARHVERVRQLGVQLDNVVEPLEQTRDGRRDVLDPRPVWRAERRGEELDNAAKAIDKATLRLAQLEDDFLALHLGRAILE